MKSWADGNGKRLVQHDTHAAYQISCVEKEKDIEQVHVCLAFPGLTESIRRNMHWQFSIRFSAAA